MKGIFEPTVWRHQKEPLSLVAQCGLCQLYKHCRTPYMKVSGKGKKRVLVVSEYPGKTEDEKGLQFVGNAGFELITLLRKIDIDLRKDCWLTNALICRPIDPETKENIPGKKLTKSVDYCRPNLSKTLKLLQPDVVIAMGEAAVKSIVPLAWGKTGEVDDVGTWAGWQIPSCKLNTWICPTYNPAYLLREKEPVIELIMLKHLKAAFSINSKPWVEKPNWEKRVKVILNPEEAAQNIESLTSKGLPLAFDYETTTLKPDGPHAEIICCSISNGVISIAYPWIGKAVEATKRFLQSPILKIGANLKFEERWTRKKLGIAVKNWQRDTVIDAHILNCHSGVTSVKFQSFVLLGIEDYDSVLEPYKKSRDGNSNSPNRLKEVEPIVLLKYCGMDSLFEYMISKIQQREMGQ